LKHNICLSEKTTSADCPAPTKALPEDTANFFMQVVTVSNHNNLA